jgi:hypothetical protein
LTHSSAGSRFVTQNSTPLLDTHGDGVGSQTIPGAVTIKLTDAQAAQASTASSLWAQGGSPNDPVLANQTSTSGMLSINLTAGETVDCTFANSFVPPTESLTITKITRRGVDSFDFAVIRDGETTGALVTATTTRAGVPADAAPESKLADLTPCD